MDLLGLSSLISGRVDKKIENKRWDHCSNCTFLTEKNRCNKCGCFMKAKIKFKKASCPIGIWNKEGK
jgi:hypothetical protein|tara:strand:- start:3527 stop:3727 length:201 start_codon:yes stop_codon:yes gene_type:complete